VRERFASFTHATHPGENVRQDQVLAWLIGLAGHGTALCFAGVFEFVLADVK
jgi:hypothetical protein